MQKEIVPGWGVAFAKVRSDFAEAKYEMEGRCRKEKWSDEKWEVENQKINDMNLSKTPNDRVFDEPTTPWYK